MRQIYKGLVRDHGYRGSYKAVARHLNRRYSKPKVRALRRVETPPDVQAQHDCFKVRVPIGRTGLKFRRWWGRFAQPSPILLGEP